MTFEIWFYYVVAVLVLTASPGPSSLLCMTKGVQHGLRKGLYTALGSLSAITIILSLSFTGLGIVIASSELVFTLVKWAGALYLVILGIQALTSKQGSYKACEQSSGQTTSWRSHYINGFIVGASNPKAIVFFTALFPQFINPSADLFTQYLVFAGTFIVLELSWLLFYTYLGSKSSRWLLAEGRAKLFNRLTGGVFIGAGVLLSTASKN